ncbi:23876_t:CDS:1, partial [Racocetra persica]
AENRTRPEQTVKSKRDTYLVDEEDGSVGSEYPNEVNEVHENNSQMQTLRELVQKSRGKTKIPRSRFATPQDEEGQSSQHHLVEDTYEMLRNVRNCRLQEEDENEGTQTLGQKMLLEFKKLENAILCFNNRLNSVADQ